MPHQVTMPMLGLTMEEGTITEWLKQPGDTVAKEEPLFVVETDKSAVEVGAPASGVLSQIIVQVGQTVAVSAPIAVIAQPGEAVEAAPAPAAASAPAPAATPVAAAPSAVAFAAAPAAAPRAAGDRLAVSPRARRVAGELGVDVTTVTGTGPDGRIVERDVRAAAAAPATAAYHAAFALMEAGDAAALAAFATLVGQAPDDALANFQLRRLLNGQRGARIEVE